MIDLDDDDHDIDTLEVKDEPKSSARVLAAIKKAEAYFNSYQALCDRIDDIYADEDENSRVEADWADPDYDLFWASMEIMKPAVYARPPKPVVSPLFKDRRQLQNTTAELLERAVTSDFYRNGIDEAMCCARDDLIFYNRGQLWLTYETDEKGGGQRVCVEHADRKDFLHAPARKWSEVPWTAKRSWLTRKQLKNRFQKTSGDAYKDVTLSAAQPDSDKGPGTTARKAGVWEVWHKEDNRVYWVSEGSAVMLDESAPHLKLRDFFPCPRPAYGTLRPRTLMPRPDYIRYAGHFQKINSLTKRIYDLLDMIRMKGLIPAGGDVGDAVEQALRDDSNSSLLIPVPSAALVAGSSSGFVTWLPLADIATAIQGLIEARRELFSDYDRLSGISDIMRGETEAEETLGAQQLKSQYGSVRVREKIDELQRIARDVTQIAAEIMSENFSQDTLLDMSQMEIPTKAEIKKKVGEVEASAKDELKKLGEKAKQMAEQAQQQQQGQQINPQAAEQQFQQAQQQIIAKYQPVLAAAEKQVPIEDVMKLLRDDKARNFAFEIETDSTVLTDEMQEKASRNEFLQEFTAASQGLMGLAAMGEAGAKLSGEMLKFALQPYRVGRSLNSVIDEFIEAAPQMAAAAAKNGGNDEAEQAMAEANKTLAQAELQKAQAAIAKVQTDAQGKVQDMQLRLAEAQQSAKENEQKLQLEVANLRGKLDLTNAQIEKIYAEIRKMGFDVQNDARTQDREDIKTAADIHSRAVDQSQKAIESDRGAAMDERQQSFSERQGMSSESRADRQQDFAEKQAEKEPA